MVADCCREKAAASAKCSKTIDFLQAFEIFLLDNDITDKAK
jgi:hypothetical protein